MLPAARLFLGVGVSHLTYKQKITAHYPTGMVPVAGRFIFG